MHRLVFRLLFVLSLALSLPAHAVETLRVLAWPGYADSDLVKAFEQRFEVHVEVSLVSSDDVLREKISAHQGTDYDVFAANSAEMQHYIDRLEHAIANSRRSGKQLAVLFVDLDRFKEINDTLGHGVGDSVLVNVAALLKSAVREVDTVARLGGDEFVILLDLSDNPQHAMVIAQKLHDRFQQAMQIGGRELHVHASMGIGIFPRDGKDADELMQNADQAMYCAKNQGRNTFGLHEGGSAG